MSAAVGAPRNKTLSARRGTLYDGVGSPAGAGVREMAFPMVCSVITYVPYDHGGV